MKIQQNFVQFIKFSIVGVINTIISYTISNIGYYIFHIHEQICNIIAFVITVFLSFILNGKFVFMKEKDETCLWRALIKVYISYSITELFLTGLLLFIEEGKLQIPHYIATLINLAITVPLNYILNKFWAYKK
jgi:putative flippase GtrA